MYTHITYVYHLDLVKQIRIIMNDFRESMGAKELQKCYASEKHLADLICCGCVAKQARCVKLKLKELMRAHVA